MKLEVAKQSNRAIPLGAKELATSQLDKPQLLLHKQDHASADA